MTSRYTLDRRPVLYGERRLSDPQVRALEALERGPLRYEHGHFGGHADPTVTAIVGAYLARFVGDQAALTAEITERGLKILAAIREATS